MKRVGVIGDTHGDLHAMADMVRKMGAVDAYVHLGDCAREAGALRETTGAAVYAVRGNNDFSSGLPDELTHMMGGVRVLITHGHLQSVKRGLLTLAAHARAAEAQVALYGHTHAPGVEWADGILLISPGACMRRVAGMRASGAVLELRGGQVVPLMLSV